VASTTTSSAAPTPTSDVRRHPTHRFAHLSDPHVTGDGSPVGGVVDARAQLARALEVLTSWNARCDAWVISGDLSDDGSVASYTWLRDTVLDAAGSVGVPVVWATGNHDDNANFRVGVLGESADPGPVDSATDVNGVRVLVVDSNVPGTPAGTVSADSLAWLRDRLAEPAASGLGTMLVVHHSPLPPLQDAAWRWPLTNPDALADVVRGSDVRAVLSGHFHHSAFGTWAGVGAGIAPSLAYTQDVTVGRDLRGQFANTGFCLVELHDDVVTHTVVPLDRGKGVHRPIAADL